VARISEDTTRASLWTQNVESLVTETGVLTAKYGEHTSSKLHKVRETNTNFSRQHGELSQYMLGQAQQANEDLQGQLFYVSETVNNLNYGVDSQASEGKKSLDGWSARMESDVTGMEDRFDNYYYSIKEYVPTNSTPAKRPIPIVRDLPVSQPAERIKELYWENQLAGGDGTMDVAVSSPIHIPMQSPNCTPVSASSASVVAALADERPSTPLANLSRAIESARLSLSSSRSIEVPVIVHASPVKEVEVVTVAPIKELVVAPISEVVAAPAVDALVIKEKTKKETTKKSEKVVVPVAAPAPVVEQMENKPANKKTGSKTVAAEAPVSKHPFVKSKKPDATLIKKLTVKDLKAFLQEEKLSDKGKKEELVDRILEHLTI
jgi:hypothetical protein